MTIFIKAIKILIDKVLKESIEDSIAADKHPIWGPFRNHELSKTQREMTEKLRRAIQDFKGTSSDEMDLKVLKRLINDANDEVEKERINPGKKDEKESGEENNDKKEEIGYEPGNLNATLTLINTSLDKLEHHINGLSFKKLFDIEEDKDPFHLFCYHAILYLGAIFFDEIKPTIEKKNKNGAVNLLLSFFTSPSAKVTGQKVKCIVEHLEECDKDLRSIKEEFYASRTKRVLQTIHLLQDNNAKICNKEQYSKDIGVSIGVFSSLYVKTPTLKPSRGRLKECMDNATAEIKKECLMLDPSENYDLESEQESHLEVL